MKKIRNILAVVSASVAFGMMAGCGGGGGDTPAPTTATKPTTVTVAAAPAGSPVGSVATTAAVTAPSSNGAPVVTIPAATVITPDFGGTLAAGPITLNVTAPATTGTTAGMKAPAGKVLAAALGAVDISIAGINGFTVPAPGLTVNVPVTSCPSASVPVTVVRYDGTSTNTTGTCDSTTKIVTVTGITKFSSVLVSPTYATGS